MIGKTLTKIMEEYGISVNELAHESNLHPLTITKFRTNKRKPRADTKQQIIKALNSLIRSQNENN